MNKLRRYLISLSLLAAILPASGGAGILGVSADRLLQQASIKYEVQLWPPSQVCKDETYPIYVLYIREGNFKSAGEVYAYTDAGKLSQSTWSIPAGTSYTLLSTDLTMKNLGKKEISFLSSNSARIADITRNVEVLDCNYTLKVEAYAMASDDLVQWFMYVSGTAKFPSQTWASLEGAPGSYALTFSGKITDEKLASGSEGLGCELAGSSFATGNFQVVGAGTDTFVMKIAYEPVEFGEGVVFHCLDSAGQESLVPLFENQTVNPGDSLPADASFTGRVATYTFPFGDTGKGTYTLIIRGNR